MCLHVHAVHNHSRLPVMAHVSGTCMKDSFKLKHLLGSTASLFCFGIYHTSTNIDDSTQYEA